MVDRRRLQWPEVRKNKPLTRSQRNGFLVGEGPFRLPSVGTNHVTYRGWLAGCPHMPLALPPYLNRGQTRVRLTLRMGAKPPPASLFQRLGRVNWGVESRLPSLCERVLGQGWVADAQPARPVREYLWGPSWWRGGGANYLCDLRLPHWFGHRNSLQNFTWTTRSWVCGVSLPGRLFARS